MPEPRAAVAPCRAEWQLVDASCGPPGVCVARRLVLASHATAKMACGRAIFGADVPLPGLSSYGEIAPDTGTSGCQFQNQIMMVTSLREVPHRAAFRRVPDPCTCGDDATLLDGTPALYLGQARWRPPGRPGGPGHARTWLDGGNLKYYVSFHRSHAHRTFSSSFPFRPGPRAGADALWCGRDACGRS